MAFDDTDNPPLLEQVLPVTTKLSSDVPALERLILYATELRTRVAKHVSTDEVGGAADTQACQAAEERMDALYAVLLETAMDVKPTAKPDLQKHLSSLPSTPPVPACASEEVRENSPASSTRIVPSYAANLKISSSRSNKRFCAAPADRSASSSMELETRKTLQAHLDPPGSSSVHGQRQDPISLEQSHNTQQLPSPQSDKHVMQMRPHKVRSLRDEEVGDEGVGDEEVGDEGVGDEEVGDEGVGDEGVGDEERDDQTNTSIPLPQSLGSCSPGRQMPGSSRAPLSQSPCDEGVQAGTVRGWVRSRRSAASKANKRLSGTAKLCSLERRKRQSCSTTGIDGLNTIVSGLGCKEAQDAIRESIRLAGRPKRFSTPLTSLDDSDQPKLSRMSLVASSVQRAMQHSSSKWHNAVMHRFDVVFLDRFYLAVCQEVSSAKDEQRPSMFLTESAVLLQLHCRQPTEIRSVGYGPESRVRDRLIDFAFLDGPPETDDDRKSMRKRLENMQRLGKRWRYLIDHVHQDVLVLLPSSVTDYSMKLAHKDVERLAELLRSRRKRLGSQTLNLAQSALKQIFVAHLRKQEEVLGEDGRLLMVPPSLYDIDQDLIIINKDDLHENLPENLDEYPTENFSSDNDVLDSLNDSSAAGCNQSIDGCGHSTGDDVLTSAGKGEATNSDPPAASLSAYAASWPTLTEMDTDSSVGDPPLSEDFLQAISNWLEYG
ncbi:hypothetical protein LTR70_009512 [Exophiala xenobiotica]|uniref:Uncharacterized protein n=1 Tax=Lithohypha guttulata TaxID=1690604 RepID=A0ABR0JXF6_9EURO|nr:hypothetical protein LTR24_009422 [Lithohypha guttulata]KAK5310406.1 hypothetical protein LTR70_009512 [Exophiala xenobiotica]